MTWLDQSALPLSLQLPQGATTSTRDESPELARKPTQATTRAAALEVEFVHLSRLAPSTTAANNVGDELRDMLTSDMRHSHQPEASTTQAKPTRIQRMVRGLFNGFNSIAAQFVLFLVYVLLMRELVDAVRTKEESHPL